MTKDEALRMALKALEVATTHLPKDRQEVLEAMQAVRQALAEPDTGVGIVGWMYEDQLPEIYPYEAMFQFSVVDVVRMFPVYAPKAEPDTGTDRGAWSDVPDATKWVDDLRGGEPEFECPRCGHCCQQVEPSQKPPFRIG